MTDFADLYGRYAADVYRFALYLTGNRGDAEDITSETFVRVWTSRAPIRTETVKGYLCTIARNLYLHSLRGRDRHVALPPDLPDRSAGPLEQTEQRDALDHVLRRLQQLSEIDRAALLMRALEDLPYEDIARALGVTTSAAKVKVHRARLAIGEPGELTRKSAT